MTTDEVQAKRKDNLQVLSDENHRSRNGDYDDSFAEFAAKYGLTWGDDEDVDLHDEHEQEAEEIPRFVSVAHDETYVMMDVFDTLIEAMNDQANIPHQGDTLNVPGGIHDLDEMEVRVEGPRSKYAGQVHIVNYGLVTYKMFAISDDAYSILCGLVQDTKTLDEREIDIEEIMGKDAAWDELRTTFPFDDYKGHDDLL